MLEDVRCICTFTAVLTLWQPLVEKEWELGVLAFEAGLVLWNPISPYYNTWNSQSCRPQTKLHCQQQHFIAPPETPSLLPFEPLRGLLKSQALKAIVPLWLDSVLVLYGAIGRDTRYLTLHSTAVVRTLPVVRIKCLMSNCWLSNCRHTQPPQLFYA